MKTVREFMSAHRRLTGERRVEAWLAGRGLCSLQGDQSIANQAGAAFRSDLNTELQALVTLSSGATAPSTTYAYQLWADTTSNTLKRRNAANSAWIAVMTLDETFVISRSSNTVLGYSDRGKAFVATAGFTQTLTAAATLADGWAVGYRIESGATIVFDPNASETIDGGATKTVVGPASGFIYCNASAFFTVGMSAVTIAAASLVGSVVPFVGMINGTIVTSRAGSAETIAIKTLAGADPSVGDPVIFVFRNVTAGTGDYVFLPATAALSVTISSGSTMGMTNSVLARIWLTVFNDAGTLRLGVVKTVSGISVMALKDDDLNSSTAEGGAGAADSAQVIYTGTAVTTKGMRLVGYLEYTLASVGTWGTAPSKIQLFGPGVSRPGQLVEVAMNETGAVATGTTTIPNDDTIPQSSEGDQYMTQAITPTSAANLLRINARVQGAISVGADVIVALFQDATANALAAINFTTLANSDNNLSICHQMVAGTVSTSTFKVRAGPANAGTFTFNGFGAARKLGGVMASSLSVEEISS